MLGAMAPSTGKLKSRMSRQHAASVSLDACAYRRLCFCRVGRFGDYCSHTIRPVSGLPLMLAGDAVTATMLDVIVPAWT